MENNMPEWLVVVLMLFMFLQGFIAAGTIYAKTPFWDGIRTIMDWSGVARGLTWLAGRAKLIKGDTIS